MYMVGISLIRIGIGKRRVFLMHYICRYTVEYRGIIVKCVWMFLLTIYIEYVKQ